MTDQEKLQSRGTFIEAGRIACRIGVDLINNPYKDEPYKSAWEKGYGQEALNVVRVKPRYNPLAGRERGRNRS